MDFIDYGQMDWFNTSKGYGVAKTIHNGEVFIHQNNIISGLINEKCYVLIGDINSDTNNNRKIGKRIIAWKTDINSFCEEIFKYWHTKQQFTFNADLKWLIEHCNEDVLIKILNSNKNQWFKDVKFLTQLKNQYRKVDDPYFIIVSEFIFEYFTKSEDKENDENLKWLINHCKGNILEKIINSNKENWFNDLQFIAQLKEKRYRFYDYKVNSDIDIVCAFILELWLNKGNNKYDNNLKWLIGINDICIVLLEKVFKMTT